VDHFIIENIVQLVKEWPSLSLRTGRVRKHARLIRRGARLIRRGIQLECFKLMLLQGGSKGESAKDE